jgi:hypothetical protein
MSSASQSSWFATPVSTSEVWRCVRVGGADGVGVRKLFDGVLITSGRAGERKEKTLEWMAAKGKVFYFRTGEMKISQPIRVALIGQ